MLVLHLKALLRKNWLIWKRNSCCSAFEILVPLIFALILALFRNFSEIIPIPLTSYLNSCFSLYSGIVPQLQFIFKDCQGNTGGFVALAPSGNQIMNDLANLLTTCNYLIHLSYV